MRDITKVRMDIVREHQRVALRKKTKRSYLDVKRVQFAFMKNYMWNDFLPSEGRRFSPNHIDITYDDNKFIYRVVFNKGVYPPR